MGVTKGGRLTSVILPVLECALGFLRRGLRSLSISLVDLVLGGPLSGARFPMRFSFPFRLRIWLVIDSATLLSHIAFRVRRGTHLPTKFERCRFPLGFYIMLEINRVVLKIFRVADTTLPFGTCTRPLRHQERRRLLQWGDNPPAASRRRMLRRRMYQPRKTKRLWLG